MALDRFLTVKEVAERLKISDATVRHRIRSGELRAIDIGTGWRIADVDFDAFLCVHTSRTRETDANAERPVNHRPRSRGEMDRWTR